MNKEDFEKTRKLNEPICPSCNKPMWKYTYVGGSYFYCSFCHLRKNFCKEIKELQEENENFRKTAAHQQTQNMERYFENERTRKTALLNLDGWRKSDAKLEKARALLKQWLQTTHAGGCDNVNLGAETEQFLAGDL